MYTRPKRLPLEKPDQNTLCLSSRCRLQAQGDLRTLIVGEVNDELMPRFAAAMIAKSRLARVKAVMEALGIGDDTLYRIRIRWQKLGLVGSFRGRRGPEGPWKILAPVERRTVELWREGKTQTQIERRLDLSQRSVGRVPKERAVRNFLRSKKNLVGPPMAVMVPGNVLANPTPTR